MIWDPAEIDTARDEAVVRVAEDAERQRVEVRRQRAVAARRNVEALGDVVGTLRDHALVPVASAASRLGQLLPWAALGVVAGGAGFLVYLALRRGPAPPVVVVRDTRRPRGHR